MNQDSYKDDWKINYSICLEGKTTKFRFIEVNENTHNLFSDNYASKNTFIQVEKFLNMISHSLKTPEEFEVQKEETIEQLEALQKQIEQLYKKLLEKISTLKQRVLNQQSKDDSLKVLLDKAYSSENENSLQKQQWEQLVSKFQDIKEKNKYTFSPTLKHQDIQIYQSTAKQLEYSQALCLIEPQLKLTNRFGIKIVQRHKCIALGIVIKRIAQEKNFIWNGNLGDGAYMISSRGLTFSHHKKEDNGSSNGFKFDYGNIIYVTFNREMKYVLFENQGKNQSTQLEVDIKENEVVHGCVLLYFKGHSVELIPQDDINYQLKINS